MRQVPITIAKGDGIGPEIMDATLRILHAAGAPLELHEVDIGESVYLKGHPAGIESSTWEKIRATQAFLKAPITTPQGGGFKSLNVTIRTVLGLYANVRPCIAYYPIVATKHPGMDVVIVRENEEDLYTGIEYRQTLETCHALKIISRPACEKIIHYAFEYARLHERKKVTCFTKDNILKLSDGLFHKTFDRIATEYPDISSEHWIVDIGAAKLADTPTAFDVVVLPNLYGDILSDVAAQIAGSVGLAGSANIGAHGAMFEAIHGSAPRRAGQNMANPSGLLLAAVMMLVHIGLPKAAALIHNAWLKTLEEGIHTYDIYKDGTSRTKVGTREFADAVICNLGKQPNTLPTVHYHESPTHAITANTSTTQQSTETKTLVGTDVFIDWKDTVDILAERIQCCLCAPWKLSLIGNRGVAVWPHKHPETACGDSWRCRFTAQGKQPVLHTDIIALLGSLAKVNLDFTHTEHLYTFDNIPGYTVAQDEQ